MASKYVKSQGELGIHYDVYPAAQTFPRLWTVLAALSLIGLFAFGRYAIPSAIVTFPLFLWQWQGPKTRKYRSQASFDVSDAGVVINSKLIPKESIHRLIIRNHVADASGDTIAYAYAGPSFHAAAGAFGSQSNAKHMRLLALVSNRLDLESGGKAYTLAGGLDDPTSYALLRELSDYLGFSVSN